ncbi:hypothetical protein JG687_00000427 [Phytophthora cactorum]|uniref:EF-hand domain-containing protein n=1 Tax=Phytophthora cactorum TaxID=29920 RepID=A0A8T1V068_9STRA|nr:hypothetical protein JG687_00000427 [Phytophthora cactorum]
MSDSRVDAMETKLREMFEVRSGYRDEQSQAALLAKHFRSFDRDSSGIVDFDEFARAMLSLNFVGVQAETEALFDRYDADLDGVLSYAEFAQVVTGCSGRVLLNGRVRSLLERVRESILEAGGKNGIRTLGVILRRMDQNGNGVIEFEEFCDGIAHLGVSDADPEELERTFRCFDRDQSGKITIDELMRGLRGSMPKRRILLVKKAFALLDTSGDGKATVEEIERLYDASQHPEVLAGRMKPRDAMLEMMSVFEQSNSRGDGVITWHEFLEYYKDLSVGITNDDEFELMIRNAWHLSGGVGWSANSSCRRVLATFRDGSQRVLEIENDLGIAASDTRRMMEKLKAQGYRDVDFSMIDKAQGGTEAGVETMDTSPNFIEKMECVILASRNDASKAMLNAVMKQDVWFRRRGDVHFDKHWDVEDVPESSASPQMLGKRKPPQSKPPTKRYRVDKAPANEFMDDTSLSEEEVLLDSDTELQSIEILESEDEDIEGDDNESVAMEYTINEESEEEEGTTENAEKVTNLCPLKPQDPGQLEAIKTWIHDVNKLIDTTVSKYLVEAKQLEICGVRRDLKEKKVNWSMAAHYDDETCWVGDLASHESEITLLGKELQKKKNDLNVLDNYPDVLTEAAAFAAAHDRKDLLKILLTSSDDKMIEEVLLQAASNAKPALVTLLLGKCDTAAYAGVFTKAASQGVLRLVQILLEK